MAAASRDEEGGGAQSVSELPLARRVSYWGFGSLVVLAAVFYLWWGLTFGVWIDNGVYSVVVVLALFGLAGMWLVSPDRPAAPVPPTSP